MNKLQSTAKKIDTLFRILHVFVKIAFVALLVGLAIIAVAFIFRLDPDMVGTGYSTLEIGYLSLTLAESIAPDPYSVLLITAVEIVLALVCVILAHFCLICIREILKPMVQGEPFHNTIAANLKKLAIYNIVIGLVSNTMEVVFSAISVFSFDLTGILISEKITHVTYNFPFELNFLVVSAVLFLASYIFRYGEELQQLSDETL